MATVVLNAYSKDYPTIVNRIRASVYLETAPTAVVASIIDSTVGHPARTWSFPGLLRGNYKFSLDEIDVSDNVITNLALFDAVPGQADGVLVRNDEQVKVGTTPGFVVGSNSFIFDGNAGTPNYIGWEIVPSELTGRGVLVDGDDYTWDSVTGRFQLLHDGDIFSQDTVYHIHFNDKIDNTGSVSEFTVKDFKITYSQTARQLTPADWGKKLIIEPNGLFLTYMLPEAKTVPEGRTMDVEIDAPSDCCVQFQTSGSDVIKFLRGNLFALPKESFSIYRYTRNGIPEFRVFNDVGNFRSVGQIVNFIQMQAGVFNALQASGQVVSVDQYARLYNEVVLKLQLSQLVSFEEHELTPENKAKFSTANINGNFYLPLLPANQYILI